MEGRYEEPVAQSVADTPSSAAESYIVDTTANQPDTVLIQKFEQAVHKPTGLYQHQDLIRLAVEHDPIDLARAAPRIPHSARLLLYRNLPDLEAKSSFLINSPSPTRVAIFRTTSDEELRALIEQMPPDEAVAILDDLPTRRVKRLFELLSDRKARRIAALQQHRRDTAGRLMTNEFFAFHLNTTVGHVVEHVREHPGTELTGGVFVLGDDLELLGYVPDRTLIVNNHDVPLRRLMRPVLHRVGPEVPRDEVVELFERYRLPALPVVDEMDRLVGVITQGDAVEMMEEMADATIASIGGTAERTSDDETTWRRFLLRAPWLVVTLIAGLLTASGCSFFHDHPWSLTALFFIPLITGMSGNVGIQCSTVIIRSMATGECSPANVSSIILRELRIGTLIGVCFGLTCGLVIYVLHHCGIQSALGDPVLVGTIVAAGVFSACLIAALLGTLSPLFFARLKVDPAIASGPIVTACNDVSATYIYFLVAWLVALVFQKLL